MAVTKRAWMLLLPLVGGLCATGCHGWPEAAPSTSWLKRNPLGAAPAAGKVVQLDVAILERPLGDPFLNKELWQHTDEMIVDLDRKAAVEDNGFRVGQIVGMTPTKLQELLTSPRYCINPRRRMVPNGQSVAQYLGPVWPRCEFEIQQGKQVLTEALDQARFCLDVKATLTDDGRSRLVFTPKVENGENALPFQPDPDKSVWTIRVDRPSKTYKDVSWEVVLAPGEYLVIGGILEKTKSLGRRSFVDDTDTPAVGAPAGGAPVQRLLVLRTARSTTGAETGEPTLEDMARSSPSPCLAVQASMNAVRANRE